MKKLFLLTALFVAAAFPSCSKHDGVETPDLPDPQPLAIAFAEGNSLEFDVDETKTVHYTITGGSSNTVVKAEMQTADDAYTVETTPASATEGTITITAKTPTDNCVLVSVSNSSQTITAEIAVSTKPIPEELAITFAEGNELFFGVDETKIVHYTITGGSDNNVVKAEMQTADDAYTVETAPTSATEGTIKITAKTPTDNCVLVTVSDGSQTVTAEITVSAKPNPEELAITFAEGNSLEFDVNEAKIIHYTITGGSDNNVVKAEMQTADDAYTVETAPTSATEGTIKITAKTPTNNCVLVTVSDGSQTVTAEITVSAKPNPEELAITFAEGNSLEFDANQTKTVHYTITGGSGNTMVKAEMQKSDDTYTVETAPTSATEGTIAITAKTPSTENSVVVTVSDGSQTVTAEITVSTKPSSQELAITFAEGNSLQLNLNEPKTINYTITGGSDNTVVKAEMQRPDDAYAVETIPTSATEGTITITAQTPSTGNCVLVTVSDGSQTVTAEIAVTLNAFDGKTVVVETPGTLSGLLYGHQTTTELTVIGNLNDKDIATLKRLSNLAILDMEHVNLDVLPNRAFEGKSLTSVKLPNTLKIIGNNAFHCNSLTSVTIPDSVTSIGIGAFSYCSSLTSVTIGNGMTSIGNEAFIGCSSLTNITIGNGVTSIGEEAFWKCSGLTSVTIPDSVTSIGEEAFSDCTGLTSVTIGNGVTSIGNGAFSGCSSLTNITIGNGVTSIGNGAFSGCSSLTNITIGNGVTSIGEWAFSGCIGLTSITIPDSVTSIGEEAFSDCTGLTSVTIGNGVTSIGEWAFSGCIGLTSITIPDSVTSIGAGAFDNCSSLTSVHITDIAKWCAIEFKTSNSYNSNPLTYAGNLYLNGELVTELVIPDSVTSIGKNAFICCSSLTSITIPDSVTSIGEEAFSDCSNLTSITIPDSVTSIGDNAFFGCSSLTSVYCKAIVPPSADYAFYNVRAALYVPTGSKAAYAAADGWKDFTQIEETQF